MIETAQKKERLLLVAVNTAEESRVRASLEELALLVDTAGGEAVGSIYQNLDHPISATYVGKGKIEEIFYDEKGVEYECYYLDANSECRGCVVPKGIWYIIDVG